MEDLIIYIVIAVVAYWIGWHLRSMVMLYNLSQNPERTIKLLEELKKIHEQETEGLPEDAIQIELEEVNGQVYAYNKSTGDFLAQGSNRDLAGLAVAARFPDKKFWHPDFKQDSQST